MKLAVLGTLFAASFLISNLVEARTVVFVCDATEQTTLNRFSGSGAVDFKDGKAEGSFTGEYNASGRDSSTISVGDLNTKGTVQVIPAGKFAANEVIVLALHAEDGGKTTQMRFNLGLNSPTSSSLIVDRISYAARCYEVQTADNL